MFVDLVDKLTKSVGESLNTIGELQTTCNCLKTDNASLREAIRSLEQQIEGKKMICKMINDLDDIYLDVAICVGTNDCASDDFVAAAVTDTYK